MNFINYVIEDIINSNSPCLLDTDYSLYLSCPYYNPDFNGQCQCNNEECEKHKKEILLKAFEKEQIKE